MERKVKINIGDWSGDGHERCDTFVVIIRGDDVSDKELKRSYDHASNIMGFNPEDVATGYEESTIPNEYYDTLIKFGFKPSTYGEDHNDYVMIYPKDGPYDEKNQFTMTSLVMFYIGYDIKNFSWEYTSDEIPTLIGGSDTILTGSRSVNLGYGLA